MDKNEQISKLKAQIEVLMDLESTTAWTGSLDRLTQKSYVLYDDVLKKINSNRREIKQLEKL